MIDISLQVAKMILSSESSEMTIICLVAPELFVMKQITSSQ